MISYSGIAFSFFFLGVVTALFGFYFCAEKIAVIILQRLGIIEIE